ncbi:MAG: AraC family transcriptional regulator [Motiliproteus sp.]
MTLSALPVSNHYLKACIRGAVRLGWSAETLLQQAAIPVDLLTAPDGQVTNQQISRLIRTVWQCTDDEHMGLSQQRCPRGTFMLMAERVLYCKTLGGMLKQSTRHYHILREDLEVGFEQRDDLLDINLSLKNAELDSDHTLQEFLILSWQRFSSWLVGHRLEPQVTRFTYPPPAHAREYPLMFGGKLEFNQTSCGYTLNSKLLNLPLVRSPDELSRFIKDSPAIMFRRLQQGNALKWQVMQLLMQFESNQLPPLELITDQLHVSARTLRRRLAEEGAPYQQLKDQVRAEKAIRLLTQENLSINEVSQLTGFAEPAAFCRAFKKWTGCQPSNYRKNV